MLSRFIDAPGKERGGEPARGGLCNCAMPGNKLCNCARAFRDIYALCKLRASPATFDGREENYCVK